jgi:hypothetical protein
MMLKKKKESGIVEQNKIFSLVTKNGLGYRYLSVDTDSGNF